MKGSNKMVVDGINVHTDSSGSGRVKPLGCKWVRIDVNWWEIERSSNSFSWSRVDATVNHYRSAGFKIYASLMGSPKWHRPSFNNPPDPALWTRFCAACARRYQGKISVFSLWNEPNLGKVFWTGGIEEFFQTVVAPGAEAIKNVNGNLLVAAADFATIGGSKWTSWLDEFRHHLKNVDIVSIHSYKKTGGDVKRAFTVGTLPVIGWIIPKWRPYNLYLNPLKKPVYLTETGREATYGNSGEMKEQAEFVKDVQKAKKSMGVDEIFFYCLYDADPSVEKPFGFYSRDGKPKNVVTA